MGANEAYASKHNKAMVIDSRVSGAGFQAHIVSRQEAGGKVLEKRAGGGGNVRCK